jgi:5-formyltetrahydrofolate cyclo-ligase
MGAGYYDRFLATGPAAGPPLRIGVAYACQQAKTLPRDPWDVPLHAVVTEQGGLSLPA